jgi:ABC-2 type transport system ATP-binding protein
MTDPIIITKGLTRDFKNNRAVNKLDIEVQTGDLFGLVGPDGAGKTTTLRLLAGLLTITEGSAYVAGYDLDKDSETIKSKIGYMAQQFSLYAELTVMENLLFFADLFDVEANNLHERVEQLLSFAGLIDFKNRWAAHLSGGMQKKLALACTLIHQPPILLLDEPTTGVDPVSRREFWNILTDLHLAGTTIIVSTPYMDEADRCSMVGLMYGGEMVICAPPKVIRAQVKGDFIKLNPDDWQTAHALIKSLPGILEVQTYGESLHILVDSYEKRVTQVENVLKDNGITYRGTRKASARMEEAFIYLINRLTSVE